MSSYCASNCGRVHIANSDYCLDCLDLQILNLQSENEALKKELADLQTRIEAMTFMSSNELKNENAELKSKLAEAVNLIELILPMAKGYANLHPVGRNIQFIIDTENALSKLRHSGGGNEEGKP